ncbi:unnamed protein product [Bursaphelenchus okinawaensis]|uniref:Uncharacterized protein n=1 Tax=Bursaphelenchus okinawaensis TaxID=465554 RepID=A0A811KP40_9BILA|nr:unnamed protein product [Bursaphelenchus okinawaensis]CAG9107080.1 unnamed protein product [Bursaphelenchus okinawaensis]
MGKAEIKKEATTTIAQQPSDAWPRLGTQSNPTTATSSFDEASSSISLPNPSPDLANLHDLSLQSPQESTAYKSPGASVQNEEKPMVSQGRSSSFCHAMMPARSVLTRRVWQSEQRVSMNREIVNREIDLYMEIERKTSDECDRKVDELAAQIIQKGPPIRSQSLVENAYQPSLSSFSPNSTEYEDNSYQKDIAARIREKHYKVMIDMGSAPGTPNSDSSGSLGRI